MPRGSSVTTAAAVVPKPLVVPNYLSVPSIMRHFQNVAIMCEWLAKSRRGGIQTREQALATILHGSELRMGPMTAVHCLKPINGVDTMLAKAMYGMILRDVPGVKKTTKELPNGFEITLECPNRNPETGRFTMEDAKTAGLLGKDNWKGYPRAMLYARALSEACGRFAPDVLCGLLSTEEMSNALAEDITVQVDSDAPEPIPAITVDASPAPLPQLPAPVEVTAPVEVVSVEETASVPSTPSTETPAVPTTTEATAHSPLMASVEKLAALRQLKDAIGVTAEEWITYLHHYQVATARDLTDAQVDAFIDELRKVRDEQAKN